MIRLPMMALIETLLPDPVAPAISRWGIRVRSTETGSPVTPHPKAIGNPPCLRTRLNAVDSITPRSETMRGS